MKKILMIDGRDSLSKPLNEAVKTLVNELLKTNQVDYFCLKNMNINNCIGCWDCWLKTPGICRLKDDHSAILHALASADEMILISDIITGFISATLKQTMDRFIPNVLPYIREFKHESHHYQRYEKRPRMHICIVSKTTTHLALIKDYFERVSLNFDSEVTSFHHIQKEGEIQHVLSHL